MMEIEYISWKHLFLAHFILFNILVRTKIVLGVNSGPHELHASIVILVN